jgi:hypothetical protein
MARAPRRLVICLDNSGYEVSLERRKIYVAIPDAEAARHGRIRVVDESGDDYLYPEERFVEAELPQATHSAGANKLHRRVMQQFNPDAQIGKPWVAVYLVVRLSGRASVKSSELGGLTRRSGKYDSSRRSRGVRKRERDFTAASMQHEIETHDHLAGRCAASL